jgi:hypothetical protein
MKIIVDVEIAIIMIFVCNTDCGKYTCINKENCIDCIDYDKYIGGEDLK